MANSRKALAAGLFAAAAITLLAPAITHANTVTGDLFFVSEATSQNAIPGNVPLTTPDVTFTAPTPLSFTSAGGYSVGAFLSSGGATILTGSAAALARSLDIGTSGMIIDFNGTVTVTNGQTFTVTHDDGLTLVIGGLPVIPVPGPTAPVTTTVTYTGPSGNLPFELVYGECCGPPAVLNISLPLSSVPSPEPASVALLVTGLIGLGLMRRRRNVV